MMTSSLVSTIASTTFGITALMLAIPNSATAFSPPANCVPQDQYAVTPDPYFTPKSTAIRKPVKKPILMPMEPEKSDLKVPLWSAPPTDTVKSSNPAGTTKPDVVWEPPRTDVSSAELKPLKPHASGLTPLTTSSNPLKDLNQKIGASQNGSIIREKSSNSGSGFNPNAFAGSPQPLMPRTPAKPSNDISLVSGSQSIPPSSINDFDSKNSFAPRSNTPAFDRPPKKDLAKTLGAFDSKKTIAPKAEKRNDLSVKTGAKPKGKIANTEPSTAEGQQSFEAGKILALVGGEPIFVGDLLFEINQMIEKFMPTAPASVKELERQKMIPQLLPRFVESKILYLGTLQLLPEEADIEQVLEQASKEFDDKALEKMIKGSGLKTSAEFDANLRAMGSSLRQLRRSWAQDQLTKYFLGQQLKVTEEVTHQEMLDSYRDNIDAYAIPAKCRWEQLMIRFDRSESRAAAKKTIADLEDEIVYGANFAAVAKKHSHGFMASTGGEHDWTTKGALVLKELDEAIFSLPVGELSDIIESPDGYHVIRVIERTAATRKPFLEAQVEIKERLETAKRQQAFDEHVSKLKREIPVEYFVNDEAKASVAAGTPLTSNR